MNKSLWRGDEQIVSRKTISANKSFDVAIVGGGFSGLWSAYHLKQIQPSLNIAIFEKDYVGFGASGRNGGWASAEYPTSSARLIKEHGLAVYQNLRKSLIESIDEIGQIAKSNNWQIEYAKGGSLVFATNNAQLSRISQDLDNEHNFLNTVEAKQLLNVQNIKGGLFTPHCAALNPFKLTSALARYLDDKGLRFLKTLRLIRSLIKSCGKWL